MGEDHDFGARLVEAFKTHRPKSRGWMSQLPDMPYAMLQQLKKADRQEAADIFKQQYLYRYDWNVCFLISRDGTPEEVVECIVMNRQAKWQNTWPLLQMILLALFFSMLAFLSRTSL